MALRAKSRNEYDAILKLKKCHADRTPRTSTELSRGLFSINIRLNALQVFEIYAVDIMAQFSSIKKGGLRHAAVMGHI
jgi:hypothetical protein